jgi:hypothetical protein
MSTLATNAITDASGGNTATINSYTPTESNMAGRNRIINGAMVIDQRNAGASVTPTSSTYTLDRWRLGASVASKVSVQRSTVVPEGFTNSTLITSLSAYTITGSASNVSGVTGTTQLVATSGATFYITGVQLEAGSVATPFERRMYGQELALAQRYYIKTNTANHYGYANQFGGNDARFSFPVTMRTNPSITTSDTAGSLNSSSPVDFNWNRTTVITSYTASAEL